MVKCAMIKPPKNDGGMILSNFIKLHCFFWDYTYIDLGWF